MQAVLQTVVFVAALGQPAPVGTVAVVGADPVLVTFSIPANTQYQLDYPFGLSYAWFDSAQSDLAYPFTTYTARSKGDLNGDGLLDGRDIQGFVANVISGSYDAHADFNNDGVVDSNDVAGMVEALLGGFPANGVTLFVEALSPSSALGDAPVNLLTLVNGNWTVTQSRAMTLVYFTTPGNGAVGTAAEFVMTPAISPLAFSATTTARWAGVALVSAGTAPAFTVDYSATQVLERSADTADLLVGDGSISGTFPQGALSTSTGITRGRVTFQFSGFGVTTGPFYFDHTSPAQFRRNVLQFDDHDPGGVQPVYGPSDSEIEVLDPPDPSNAQCDTLWAYQFALEVPIAKNANSAALAPQSLAADLFSYDAYGLPVDSLLGTPVSKFDNADPDFILYRSDLVRPMIFVNANVNKANFPTVRILIVSSGGSVVLRRHGG